MILSGMVGKSSIQSQLYTYAAVSLLLTISCPEPGNTFEDLWLVPVNLL